MKNKGLIYFLTITISFLSIYYLQFTFVSQRIQGEATEISRDSEGNIDFKKKQKYLDSIWNKPVYNLVSDFTFKDKLVCFFALYNVKGLQHVKRWYISGVGN